MAGKRIYLVGTKDGVRLVKAAVRQQALTHVANSLFEIRVASQDDLVEALGNGVKIEQYSGEQEELEFGV